MIIRLLFTFAVFLCTASLAEEVNRPKIIETQNGNISNFQIEGSLASTQVIGCIPLQLTKATYTPPDLYKGVSVCLKDQKYDTAAQLFVVAGLYYRFDGERIKDRTAAQGGRVLIMQTFANVPQDVKTNSGTALDRLLKNQDQLAALCVQIRVIGAPNYFPRYMVLHGIAAFTKDDPLANALVESFDAQTTWLRLLNDQIHCPKSEK